MPYPLIGSFPKYFWKRQGRGRPTLLLIKKPVPGLLLAHIKYYNIDLIDLVTYTSTSYSCYDKYMVFSVNYTQMCSIKKELLIYLGPCGKEPPLPTSRRK